MSAWLLLAAWVWPLLLAVPAAGAGQSRSGAQPNGAASSSPLASRYSPPLLLPALGPVPALIAALAVPVGTELSLPWLFLGTTLALDATSRVYLLFTSILWIVAGVYAGFAQHGRPHARRFSILFLLAMTGNLWLIVGADILSFYVGFAIMGLAAYGLVIHDGSAAALRAGKVYLVMALLGEVCLFAGLVMIAHHTGTTLPRPIDLVGLSPLGIGLVLAGLGVKAGLVPLHLWLPLAHPAAPIPASAVLSGTMIKVALLGWLRFLPVGAIALPDWGALVAAAGLLTLCYALPIGLVQTDPKVLLAYSSISKMGLMVLVLGCILMQPALAPIGVAAIAFYAGHHALVKGGLFLGVGMRKYAAVRQPLVLGALVFLALALAGAPFTSGAVAKAGLEPVLKAADWSWISAAVSLATVGAALLMSRFVWVCVRAEHHAEPGYLWPALAWAVLIGLVALFPFLLGKAATWLTNAVTVPVGIGLALLVSLLARLKPAWLRPLIGLIPPGDILALWRPAARAGVWLGRKLWRSWSTVAEPLRAQVRATFDQIFAKPAADVEHGLRRWPVAGGLWIGISALLLLFVLAGQPLVPVTTASQPQIESAGVEAPARQPPTVAEPSSNQEMAPGPTMPAIAEVPAPALGKTDASMASMPPPPASEPTAPSTAVQAAEPMSAEEAAGIAASEPRDKTVAGESLVVTDDAASPPSPAGICQPPAPYVFRPSGADGQALELNRCGSASSSVERPLRAPALTNELVALVQQALQTRGYSPGPVDGLIGPRTRAAVRRLQRDSGLPVDGIISFEVLDRLQSERMP
jgi:hydrogenase-4 component B